MHIHVTVMVTIEVYLFIFRVMQEQEPAQPDFKKGR